MIFFKYVGLLEKQNELLRQENERLNNRIAELTNAFIPALRQQNAISQNLQLVTPRVQHKIEHKDNDNFATCPCGWNSVSDDPAELRSSIEKHHRESLPSVKAEPRKSWPVIKAKLEA